jgi:MFS family permease
MSETQQADLDRWVEHGLMTGEQRDTILSYERARIHAEHVPEAGPGRLASAISTVGAAVAIAAVTGIMAIFASDWSSTQAAIVAAIGSAVMIAAGWLLIRNGWGAPAGLFAICGLILMPVALGFIAHSLGWWTDGDTDEIVRKQQRILGVALLIAIPPGVLTFRLGLRQAWAALPTALWFGIALLIADPFATIALVVAQVAFGAVVAGAATFIWGRGETGRSSAWWLQIGGLILAAQGIVFSAFEERAVFALLGVLAAAVIFTVGVTRNRTAWIVAGAVSATIPAGRLIFEYFEGLGGLFLVAMLGLGLAFLPLLLIRRRTTPDAT